MRELRARATSCGACSCPGAVGTVEKLTAGDGGCGGMARYASENGSGVTRKAYVRPGRRLLICGAKGRLKLWRRMTSLAPRPLNLTAQT